MGLLVMHVEHAYPGVLTPPPASSLVLCSLISPAVRPIPVGAQKAWLESRARV
jgi:hypothetical protein